jgi:lipopolysaccharide export LptBFGC system permease protein LptF
MKKTNIDNAVKIFMVMFFGFIGCCMAFVLSILVFSMLGVDIWHTFIYAAIMSLLGIAVAFLILAVKRMV